MFRNFQLRAQFNREKPPPSTGSGKSDVKDKTGKDVDAVVAPPIELKFDKIRTTVKSGGEHDDDDFAPLLGEKAHIYVKITNLPNGVKRKLKIDIGRTTKTGFALVAEVKQDVTGTDSPITERVVWDGQATKAVARQFSDRKTKDHNAGSDVNIPLEKITSGKAVPHGLYVIDQITLLDGTTEVKKLKPVDKGMSVPAIVNLTFNAKWIDDLKAFGLEPLSDNLKEALRRFGGRDYMIADATVANRINARFVIDAGTTKDQGMLVDIGGTNLQCNQGLTPWPRMQQPKRNIFAILQGLGKTISVYPGAFMYWNKETPLGVEKTAFQNIFSPLGVAATAGYISPGVAAARSVASGTGKVQGACTALDSANVTLTLNANGLLDEVESKNTSKVPEDRAKEIKTAFNSFVKMVGNVMSHETGHSFGSVSPKTPSSNLKVEGVTIKSPLDGDSGAHNKSATATTTGIMDSGFYRQFKRIVEANGTQQKFDGSNAQYLRECISYDPRDD
ncbi:MAG: hypothetical protein KAW61_04460 [candidate division Zixibacteria bacterium]|nr:hypothetical protein [candidate division Zixibacteria bacterium]